MIVGSPVTPWDELSHPGVFLPPRDLVEQRNENRLIRALREAAQTKDPTQLLSRAAARFFFTVQGQGPSVTLGNAFADLAVTGRDAYSAFRDLDMTIPDGPSLRALEEATRLRLASEAPTDAEIEAAVNQALDRAYQVAWALRGPVSERAARRSKLGWIAVSGEDDVPHRPVNVPAPPYEQYSINVATRVRTGPILLSTRFFVASAEPAPKPTPAFSPRQVPSDPDPAQSIPPDHEILLFLHGHSSGAEEAVDFIPHLLEQGLAWGKKYSVVSFDLPNNGYSQTFDHTRVAPAGETNYPFLPNDTAPITTPTLDFIEDFVVSFVNALDETTRDSAPRSIKERFAAVIGGSLGGNLGLRLGRRDPLPSWLNQAIVAWSPASVWKAMVRNDPRREGPRHCAAEFVKPETGSSRQDYFHQVYEKEQLPGVLKQQSLYWYRKGYPAAGLQVALSRIARHEIYNPFYRQWHWRVACEQLIFSHFENEVFGDNSTPVRYTKNTVRTLLASGEDDNYSFTGIYDATRTLGNAMVQTPGRLLLVRDTGHSIHAERPDFLSREIMKFLNAKSIEIRCITRKNGHLRSVGVFDHTRQVEDTMTQAQCILAIHRGHDLFVMGPDGDRAAVVIGYRQGAVDSGEGHYFIKTVADGSEPNNLLALKACGQP